ncbi:YhcG family protein [Flammeovirga sp. EKP202]|uniref:PDDEXK nuclease domain-containing protein n=1 Tax=Flammeovirga sp. EKP202 TaxID=2770592 RepID=UPI00165FF8EF|nr:PDDEXK nuclease domain-containing protein [Flammeovirga sp. EKP202]MBD0404121.1 DUF1016 domain-containing protein [Flammeovirga sp. EKP202]
MSDKNNESRSFEEFLKLIKVSKDKAIRSVNKDLIELYWNLGEYISKKCTLDNWGTNVVKQLSLYISKSIHNNKGFSSQNLWRMKQFYEHYLDKQKLSPLVREISWSNNLLIISQCKSIEETEFYLKITQEEKYSKRELQRQLESSLYERSMLSKENISPVAREVYPDLNQHIKDSYIFEFLDLKDQYSEYSFQKEILKNLKSFILEFGKDFLFIDEEFKLQVGNQDYKIDLLFYHRELHCLVAIELKIGDFKPEYMGKMDFYLGALDKYVKKDHENPSVGIILCKSKDESIVEISLNRSTSPTVVSQYETKLLGKEILRNKLEELFNKK